MNNTADYINYTVDPSNYIPTNIQLEVVPALPQVEHNNQTGFNCTKTSQQNQYPG